MAEKKSKAPSTVKFPQSTLDKIDLAAEITGLPKQEIIRLCTAIGLEDLRRIDYDLAGTVVDMVRGPVKKREASGLKVAEDKTEFNT